MGLTETFNVNSSGDTQVAVTGTVPVSVAAAPVLVAGSAIIGKVGIDQTSPGTSNLVQAQLNAETTKVIGTVNVAAAQTIAAVTAITNALPAGTNVLGHVIMDPGSTTAITGTVSTTVGGGSIGTQSSVASSATSTTILASNAIRKGVMVYNDSTQILRLNFSATASATAFCILLQPNAFYENGPLYTGVISGIWASANGNARVMEIT